MFGIQTIIIALLVLTASVAVHPLVGIAAVAVVFLVGLLATMSVAVTVSNTITHGWGETAWRITAMVVGEAIESAMNGNKSMRFQGADAKADRAMREVKNSDAHHFLRGVLNVLGPVAVYPSFVFVESRIN